MRPGRAADQSPPSSAAVIPLGHTGSVTGYFYPYSSFVTFSPLLSWYSEHTGAREMRGTFVSFCGQLQHSKELQYVEVTITVKF